MKFHWLTKNELNGLVQDYSFLHAKPWIAGGEKSIFSRLLFTSEDWLCANLRMWEQSTNMTSQNQCPTFARDITDQL